MGSFNISHDWFTLIFYRRLQDGSFSVNAAENVPEKDLVKDLEKLSVNQKNIFDLIKANNNITQEELSHKIGINQRNIRNNISRLKKLNLIRRIGPDKGGHWEVV